jgi:hypothetical protein
VGASYVREQTDLSLVVSGNGTVISDPAGLRCGPIKAAVCQAKRGFGCGVRKFGRTPQNIQFAGKTNLPTPHLQLAACVLEDLTDGLRAVFRAVDQFSPDLRLVAKGGHIEGHNTLLL